MLTIRSVLCPVDFSEQSREALAWAYAIANRSGATLHVLTAVDPLLAQAAKTRLGFDLARSETEPALRDFVNATLPAGPQQQAQVRLDVRVGDAAEAILQASSDEICDLIVMGTHGLGGLRKLLLGSTTERVLRSTEKAVLAVPKGIAPAADATVSPLAHLRRILIATDFREGSSAAVQWAIELAQDLAVPIVFVHVVKPVVVPTEYREVVDNVDEENVVLAERDLRTFAARVTTVQSERIVSLGDPEEAIASLATKHQAGLIVMGLTNEPGSKHGPGSTAYRVLRSAHLAVLVVPPSVRRSE
jgi:nucleotide-binding universal stress UspA family protein